MNDILDEIKEDNKYTNYRKWSFKILIYIVILLTIVFFRIVNYESGLLNENGMMTNFLKYSSILTGILMLVGFVLTILMIIKKEKQDYKYWISIIGYLVLLLIESSRLIYYMID